MDAYATGLKLYCFMILETAVEPRKKVQDFEPQLLAAGVEHSQKVKATCDRYVIKLGGESPSRALVRRTVREGKGVHREMESEESRIQNAGPTNRKYIRGRGS